MDVSKKLIIMVNNYVTSCRSIKDAILELNDSQGLTTGAVYDAITQFMRFEGDKPDPYPWGCGELMYMTVALN